MSLDLWFRQDCERILTSVLTTMQASQAATAPNEEYQQGFADAIRAVAMAFGLTAPSQILTPPPRPDLPSTRVIGRR
jgi:hypothetical protein